MTRRRAGPRFIVTTSQTMSLSADIAIHLLTICISSVEKKCDELQSPKTDISNLRFSNKAASYHHGRHLYLDDNFSASNRPKISGIPIDKNSVLR
jgi:hypothetical protein